MSRKPSQAVGAERVEELQKWIAKTPVDKIPRNSAGLSSKSAICRAIGISKSTIGSNKRIKQIFASLDVKLLESSPQSSRAANQKDLAVPSAPEFIALLDELEALRAALARLNHLSSTGHWITI